MVRTRQAKKNGDGGLTSMLKTVKKVQPALQRRKLAQRQATKKACLKIAKNANFVQKDLFLDGSCTTNTCLVERNVSRNDDALNVQQKDVEDKIDEALERLSVAWIPDKARGREEESKQIHDFLQSNLNTGHGNSLYISGLPGSGKTLTLKQTLTSVLSLYPSIKFQTIFLNCASLSTPALLYPALLDSLNIITTTTSKNNKETLRDHFTKREEPLILILDELDYLTSRDQAILYQIFSWPRLPNSRVTVIGIANAVDLPQRLLPWLRASQCIPTILPFAPYTASQLVDIVTQRLGDEGADDSVFGTGPLMLITKRVAAASGDARRCLDICRMALLKSKQQYEQEGILKESAKRFCSMKAVASVLQEAGGASSAVHAIQGLPMTQQIVLCVIANKCCISSTCINSTSKIKGIVSKVSNASGMVLNLGQAYSYYGRWCSRAKVDAVPWGDFVEIVGVLRHHHLLDVNEGGSPKRRNGKGVTKQKGKRGQRNGVQGKNASNAMKMKGWIVGIKCALEDIQKGCESKKLLRVLVGSETGKAK